MILNPARTLTYALILSLALAFLGWGLSAPTAQGQDLAQVYMITPEQGSASGLEAALRQHATWREENGDPWGWNVYEVVQGKHPGTYIVRSPNHTWADFDEYTQGFGPKGGQHYAATVAPMTASISSSIAETDTALTHWPDDMSGYVLFEVDSYRLRPGHGQDFHEALEKAFQAVTQETEERYLGTADVVNGAEDDYVRLVIPHASWADFKAPERTVEDILVEVYGEDETEELFEQFGNAFRSSYNMVVRYRPELSVESQQ